MYISVAQDAYKTNKISYNMLYEFESPYHHVIIHILMHLVSHLESNEQNCNILIFLH